MACLLSEVKPVSDIVMSLDWRREDVIKTPVGVKSPW